MNACPLRVYGFHFCDIGNHAVSDASKCIIYNRARLVYEEQKAPLLNLTIQNAANAHASRRNEMICLELTEEAIKRSDMEMRVAGEIMQRRLRKAYNAEGII
jgi:hypothetical protein